MRISFLAEPLKEIGDLRDAMREQAKSSVPSRYHCIRFRVLQHGSDLGLVREGYKPDQENFKSQLGLQTVGTRIRVVRRSMALNRQAAGEHSIVLE